ncbi:MAG: DUF6382 domain-containing protein [Eubacteriales bacterium]|nr:DUF6382 domain-containing protein [Eubacteriales bacterium]MDY3332586.1 DUF6382 domain-containing protein [Gallibacter sp.]
MLQEENSYVVDKEFNNMMEIKVMENNICDILLPYSVIRDDDLVIIKYFTNGYCSLDKWTPRNIREVFEILEKILIRLNKCIMYYILPEQISLDGRNIYINLKNKEIKFMFLPQKGKISLLKLILVMMDVLYEKLDVETSIYLDELKNEFELSNYDLKMMIVAVSNMRKNIYKCARV